MKDFSRCLLALACLYGGWRVMQADVPNPLFRLVLVVWLVTLVSGLTVALCDAKAKP